VKVALLVLGYPSPERPSAGVFHRRAANALAGLVDLTVVHLRTWRPGRPLVARETGEGFAIVRLALPMLPVFGNGRSAAPWLAADIAKTRHLGGWITARLLAGTQVIHAVGASYLGAVAGGWAARQGAALVVQAIGSDVNSDLPSLHRWPGVRGWQRRVHGVACNSAALSRAIRVYVPEGTAVEVVYRGTDLDEFAPLGPCDEEVASLPGFRFGFLGGMPTYSWLPGGDDLKGGRTLMAAWARAEARNDWPLASLLLAGPGVEMRKVEPWLGRLRHPERVVVAGELPPERLAAVYRACHAVLLPSREEGLPNVAVEAAASGRAVLGSDVGGVGEVVENGVTGRLLPPCDRDSWAGAMSQLAADPGQAATMGRAARVRAERLFDRRSYAPAMVQLYATALRAVGR
jgi:glycosyltransferase involved in cell wall biosynthesis